MKIICSIEGCGKPIKSRGWCNPHYRRWLRHGDPTAGDCRRLGVAENGRPYCVHGEMLCPSRWTCPESYRKAHERYESSSLRLRVGGLRFTYRVTPRKKDEIKERLGAFKEHQARTRQEVAENGRIY